ncbi:hypothetical protein SNEBB_001867 [Seison nebaliae]|nr:hypothetical protein SNEBB_001867 [Seison nebaliae]
MQEYPFLLRSRPEQLDSINLEEGEVFAWYSTRMNVSLNSYRKGSLLFKYKELRMGLMLQKEDKTIGELYFKLHTDVSCADKYKLKTTPISKQGEALWNWTGLTWANRQLSSKFSRSISKGFDFNLVTSNFLKNYTFVIEEQCFIYRCFEEDPLRLVMHVHMYDNCEEDFLVKTNECLFFQFYNYVLGEMTSPLLGHMVRSYAKNKDLTEKFHIDLHKKTVVIVYRYIEDVVMNLSKVWDAFLKIKMIENEYHIYVKNLPTEIVNISEIIFQNPNRDKLIPSDYGLNSMDAWGNIILKKEFPIWKDISKRSRISHDAAIAELEETEEKIDNETFAEPFNLKEKSIKSRKIYSGFEGRPWLHHNKFKPYLSVENSKLEEIHKIKRMYDRSLKRIDYACQNAKIELCSIFSKSLNENEFNIIYEKYKYRKESYDQSLKDSVQQTLNNISKSRTILDKCKKELDKVGNVNNFICNKIQLNKEPIAQLSGLNTELNNYLGERINYQIYHYLLSYQNFFKEIEEQLINGNFLVSHKHLCCLENIQNTLFWRLHGTSSTNNSRKIVEIQIFFVKYHQQVQELHDKMKYHFQKIFLIAKSKPELIVTILRIIEREEIMDEYWEKKLKGKQIAEIQRPKHFRKNYNLIFKSVIEKRIDDIIWKYTSSGRMNSSLVFDNLHLQFVKDFRMVNFHLSYCFPPSYNIAEVWLTHFFKSLHEYFEDFHQKLPSNEDILLLRCKDNVYKQLETFQQLHKFYSNDFIHSLQLILSEETQIEIYKKFKENLKEKLEDRLKNLLVHEIDEWKKVNQNFTNFNVTFSVVILQLIQYNINLCQSVSTTQFYDIFLIILEVLKEFLQKLTHAVYQYHKKIIKKNENRNYSYQLVMLTNNNRYLRANIIIIFEKYILSTINNFRGKMTISQLNEYYERILNQSQKLYLNLLDYLINEIAKNLTKTFESIGSKQWLNETSKLTHKNIVNITNDFQSPIWKIVQETEKNFEDFEKLHSKIKIDLIDIWKKHIVIRYLYNFCHCHYKPYCHKSRKLIAERLILEMDELYALFNYISSSLNIQQEFYPLNAIGYVAQILECSKSKIRFYLEPFINDYQDIQIGQLKNVLSIRNDTSQSELKSLIIIYQTMKYTQSANGIFSLMAKLSEMD